MPKDTLLDLAVDYLLTHSAATQEPKKKRNPSTHSFVEEYVETVAGLSLPKGDSADSVRHISGLLAAYANDPLEQKPLSIAIFGPPGSGKSTFVRNICENVDQIHRAKTINLTQVADTKELANALFSAVPVQNSDRVPVIFFDEFDSMYAGAPQGWLSWFLAPMEDGVFLVDRREVSVGKAIFIFAGGTAETLDDFSDRAALHPEAYRARKVPDFVSRLRGAIDISGVNGQGDHRIIQRALTLSYFLQGGKAETFGKDRIRRTLTNGYFVHGARSMKSFVNTVLAGHKVSEVPGVIRRQHFSRGQFDGLSIGLSAGLEAGTSQAFTRALTEQLLRNGAGLAYAGAFLPKGTLDALQSAAEAAPRELVEGATDKPCIVNYLGNPAWHNEPEPSSKILQTENLVTIEDAELQALGAPVGKFFRAFPEEGDAYQPNLHAAWAISQFRLRVRAIGEMDALIAIGGKDDGESWGRLSGIAEEVMIALALGKPVYVLGGAEGAAKSVGKLLGLDSVMPSIERCLVPPCGEGLDEILAAHSNEFAIPGVPDSPKTLQEVRQFLFDRGIGTASWPKNGLSVSESREVFECELPKDIDQAVATILKGLSRQGWKQIIG